jgi:hypothetical protein
MLEGVSHLPFTDTDKWQGMAASVRMGSEGLSTSIRATTNSLGGAPAGSISSNVEKGTRQQSASETKQANSTAANNQPIILTSYTTVDGVAIAKTTTQYQNLVPGQTKG